MYFLTDFFADRRERATPKGASPVDCGGAGWCVIPRACALRLPGEACALRLAVEACVAIALRTLSALVARSLHSLIVTAPAYRPCTNFLRPPSQDPFLCITGSMHDADNQNLVSRHVVKPHKWKLP
jgi:hypothetical protein